MNFTAVNEIEQVEKNLIATRRRINILMAVFVVALCITLAFAIKAALPTQPVPNVLFK